MRRHTVAKAVLVLMLGIALGAGAAWTAERHPEIRAAQRDLQHAKARLERAAHDFGGHRVKAIEHINGALDELREALEYDRR